MKEEFIEEGTVKSVNGKLAEVILTNKEECKECSARIICKPANENENLIEVIDPYGVATGDIVRFSLSGSSMLKASWQLYFIPLVLFVLGILLGYSLLEEVELKELYAFLMGALLTAAYYIILSLLKKNSNPLMPIIISVKKAE